MTPGLKKHTAVIGGKNDCRGKDLRMTRDPVAGAAAACGTVIITETRLMTKPRNEDTYKPRIIDPELDGSLRRFGAVCIEGPRHCGKSETAGRLCASELSLDASPAIDSPDRSSRRLAEISPGMAIDGATPRLIDEWQNVPAVWDAVRTRVDRRVEPGQFVLTQSASPLNLRTYHTGIGRIASVRMRTMSLFETGDSSGEVSLKALCEGDMTPSYTRKATLDDIARFIVRGGWPEAIKEDSDAPALISSYTSPLADGYAGDVDGIRYDGGIMRRILVSLARREGTSASLRTIAKDVASPGDGSENLSVSVPTVSRYLDFLERAYVTDDTQAFPPFGTIGSSGRISQEKKRRFCDVSLACSLLGVTREGLFDDFDMFERLFESLCVHDLKVYADSFGAEVYYYRDYHGNKIDAVVELKDERWCAIDTVLGVPDIDPACDDLKKTVRTIEKKGGASPSAMCIVCGLADAAVRREDGIFVVPLTALRP